MKFWQKFWEYYDLGATKATRVRMKKNPEKYIEVNNWPTKIISAYGIEAEVGKLRGQLENER